MRSPEALKPRETHRTPNWPGAELSMETIRAYLADLSGRGRRKGTVQMYSAKLRALYDYLPPGQADLPGNAGCLASIPAGGRVFPQHREYPPVCRQRADGVHGAAGPAVGGAAGGGQGLQPELSRVEYLRLLQAARILEKERTYLLVKIFALAGIRVGELPQVTVERVRAGACRSVPAGSGGTSCCPPVCRGSCWTTPGGRPDGGAGVLHPERERHEPDPGDGGDPDPVS